MKRIIVTGANGFVGRHALPPLLKRDYEVHAVSNTEPEENLRLDGVTWHKTDLLADDGAARLSEKIGADELLHFAWYVEHGKFWESPKNELWIDASMRLIRSFEENGGRRVVVAGTCFEYQMDGGQALSESDTPLNPASLYGRSKTALFRKLADAGVAWAWGRVFFIYGPYENEKRLVAAVVNSLLRDETAECFNGDNIRDFLFAADIGDAFAALTDSTVTGAVNLASGEPVSIREIVNAIRKCVPDSGNIRFGDIVAPKAEPKKIVADITRLRDELKWRPGFALREGIAETVNWWKSQNL